MKYIGDFNLGDIVDLWFNTVNGTDAPITLAGTPAVAAYMNGNLTEVTAGLTLSVDWDARVGLHRVSIDTAGANGFSTGTNVTIVLTAGTVDGVSVVGAEVGCFSINYRSALTPTVAGRTLDVASTGEAGIDLGNALVPEGAIPWLGIVDSGTPSSVTATTLVTRLTQPDGSIRPGMVLFCLGSTQGYWQSVVIDSVAADTLTIAAWPVATPSGTLSYYVQGVPAQSAANLLNVNVAKQNNATVYGVGTAANKWRGTP